MTWQVTWDVLQKSARAGHLSDHRIASLYKALGDADAIIEAALRYRTACSEGDKAMVQEEYGDAPKRSSDSWFEEAGEAEQELFAALERLELANEQGYS